jgi:hypothetical protein
VKTYPLELGGGEFSYILTTRTSRNQTGFYPSSFFSKINAQRIDEDQRIKTNNGKMIKGKIIGGARRVF